MWAVLPDFPLHKLWIRFIWRYICHTWRCRCGPFTCELCLPGRPVLRSGRASSPVGGSEGAAAGAAAPAVPVEAGASPYDRHTRTPAGAGFHWVGTRSSDDDERPIWVVGSQPLCSLRSSCSLGCAQPSTLSGGGVLWWWRHDGKAVYSMHTVVASVCRPTCLYLCRLHSLCNAVYWRHTPRKPSPGAERLATPNTNHYDGSSHEPLLYDRIDEDGRQWVTISSRWMVGTFPCVLS